MKAELLQRYEPDIVGVLGCFDRVVVTGTLTEVAYPDALAAVLHREGIRCFDIGQFAEPLRQRRSRERTGAGASSRL
jgi:hypothetical protein